MRVLIAEDDAALFMFLKRGLELERYSVKSAGNEEAVLESALSDPPDLLILDLNFPGRAGIQVLKALQQVNLGVPTLVLTGRSSVEDCVSCLDLGADDYLQKPFSLNELLTRCRALQPQGSAASMVIHGDLCLDRMSRAVKRSGIAVDLTAKEHAMLDYFIRHRGRIIDRAELLTEVFKLVAETQTNVVDVYVSNLRTKLKIKADSSSLIETVRGKGYVIRLPENSSESKRPVQSVTLPTED